MIADQDQIALAITASKNTSALKDAAAEVDQLGAASQRASASAGTATASLGRIGESRSGIKRGADALVNLSFAAQASQLGAQGAALAFGRLAESVAEMSGLVEAAEIATGIGAVVALLAAGAAILHQMGSQEREIEQHDENRAESNARTVASQTQLLNAMKQQEASLRSQAGFLGVIDFWLEDHLHVGWGHIADVVERVFNLSEKIKDTTVDEARAARDRGIEYKKSYDTQLQSLTLETEIANLHARSVDSLARQTYEQQLQADAQLADRVRQINLSYEQRDADGKIIALTADQIAQRAALVQAARDAAEAAKAEADATATQTRLLLDQAAAHRLAQGSDATDDYQDRIRQIEEERDAAIRSGEDRVLAEQEAQQKIRALQMQRFDDAKKGYAAMSQAAILHGTIIGQVASVAAKAIAIYEMIPQAKKDAQMGKSEFAAALKDFATPGKQPLGAMHLLASGAYFSAAAFGFAEAAGLGGGGGSAGGTGGGGGAPGDSSTFEPVGSSAGGGLTINLITKDPYGREAISQTIYELGRSQVLKRPIPIAPTTGLLVAGAH